MRTAQHQAAAGPGSPAQASPRTENPARDVVVNESMAAESLANENVTQAPLVIVAGARSIARGC